MRIQIPSVGTAVFFTILSMGVLGVFVLAPIACIQWAWNAVIHSFPLLPVINVWQATLLYLAMATVVYLSGVIRIEFETEHLD